MKFNKINKVIIVLGIILISTFLFVYVLKQFNLYEGLDPSDYPKDLLNQTAQIPKIPNVNIPPPPPAVPPSVLIMSGSGSGSGSGSSFGSSDAFIKSNTSSVTSTETKPTSTSSNVTIYNF